MTFDELTYGDLALPLGEVYEQMGYGGAEPGDDVKDEVAAVERQISALLRPRYCFFVAKGELDTAANTLTVGATCLNVGRIISRQLRGSQAFAFFVVTAGVEFEDYQMRLKDDDDMVRKGYGWMLKSASRAHEKEVFEYVVKNKGKMPRTALRYAIEKMPKDLKAKAMAK